MPYPTLEELQQASSVPEFTGADDDAAAAMRLAAIAGVEEFCGQTFDAQDGTVRVSSNGGRTLFLPRRLASLDSITAVTTAVDLDDVALSDRHDRLVIIDWRAGAGAYEKTLREMSGETNVAWPSGDAVIEVTGTWGWEDPPDEVVAAIRMDCEDTARADANELMPTVAAMRALGLRSTSQGNLRLDVGEPSVLSPRAARLLVGLVWLPSAGERA